MTRGKSWQKKIKREKKREKERKREKIREKGEKEREKKKRNRAQREKKDIPKIYWQKCSKSDKIGGPVVAHYHY